MKPPDMTTQAATEYPTSKESDPHIMFVQSMKDMH